MRLFEHLIHSNFEFENKTAMNYKFNPLIYNCNQNLSDELELISSSPLYITKTSYISVGSLFTGATIAASSSRRYQNSKFYGRFS